MSGWSALKMASLDRARTERPQKRWSADLSRKLTAWTGRRWMVVVSDERSAPTLRAQAEERDAELKRGVRGDPLVQAVLNRFPGAEIVAVRGPRSDVPQPMADPNMPADPDLTEDNE